MMTRVSEINLKLENLHIQRSLEHDEFFYRDFVYDQKYNIRKKTK